MRAEETRAQVCMRANTLFSAPSIRPRVPTRLVVTTDLNLAALPAAFFSGKLLNGIREFAGGRSGSPPRPSPGSVYAFRTAADGSLAPLGEAKDGCGNAAHLDISADGGWLCDGRQTEFEPRFRWAGPLNRQLCDW